MLDTERHINFSLNKTACIAKFCGIGCFACLTCFAEDTVFYKNSDKRPVDLSSCWPIVLLTYRPVDPSLRFKTCCSNVLLTLPWGSKHVVQTTVPRDLHLGFFLSLNWPIWSHPWQAQACSIMASILHRFLHRKFEFWLHRVTDILKFKKIAYVTPFLNLDLSISS